MATACSSKFPVLFPVLRYLLEFNISCFVCLEFGCRIMCAANLVLCLLIYSESSVALQSLQGGQSCTIVYDTRSCIPFVSCNFVSCKAKYTKIHTK